MIVGEINLDEETCRGIVRFTMNARDREAITVPMSRSKASLSVDPKRGEYPTCSNKCERVQQHPAGSSLNTEQWPGQQFDLRSLPRGT